MFLVVDCSLKKLIFKYLPDSYPLAIPITDARWDNIDLLLNNNNIEKIRNCLKNSAEQKKPQFLEFNLFSKRPIKRYAVIYPPYNDVSIILIYPVKPIKILNSLKDN